MRHALGERGLAEAGRPVQQNVIQGLAAGAGGVDEHLQVLAGLPLAHEIAEAARPDRGLAVIGLAALALDHALGRLRPGLGAALGSLGLHRASSLRLALIKASTDALPPRAPATVATAPNASLRP